MTYTTRRKTKLLAAADLQAVNVTNKIYEKADKKTEVNKVRFVNLSNASTDEIITKAKTKNGQENTKWAVCVFDCKLYFFKDVYISTLL